MSLAATKKKLLCQKKYLDKNKKIVNTRSMTDIHNLSQRIWLLK